jgi:hypothetical protein
MAFTLRNYPLVIDPASPAIDLLFTEEVDSSTDTKPVCRQLGRIASDFPFTQTTDQAHVFADNDSIELAKYLLVYNAVGRLTQLWTRTSKQNWNVHDVTPEAAGSLDLYPSIRLLFASKLDQTRFMQLLRSMSLAMQQSSSPSPRDAAEMMLIVGRSPEQPRLIYVEPIHEQQPTELHAE